MASESPQPKWSEARIARELGTWFDEQAFAEWPSYRTFVEHGRKRLHAQLVRTGGPTRWATELGVALGEPRVGGKLRDDEIRPALEALLAQHNLTKFPTLAWLRQHGPRGLGETARAVLRQPLSVGKRISPWAASSTVVIVGHDSDAGRSVGAGSARWPLSAASGG
jgi:hypothetical protein